jgi:integrase
MRGHIRKHGAGWQYTVELEPDPATGKRRQKSKGGFKSKKECEQAMNKLMAELEKGDYFETSNMLLRDYLSYWLNNYASSNVAPSTLKRYKLSISDINAFIGNVPLSKLKPAHIQDLYSQLMSNKHQSKSTVLKTHRTFSISLKHAIKWQLINSNPCNNVQPPRPNAVTMKVWDMETSNKFISKIKNENIYIPVLIALHTGLREGEICALKWDDIDLEDKTLTVKHTLQRIYSELCLKEPKTKKSRRTIAMMDSTVSTLKQYKREQMIYKLALGEDYNNENYVCSWNDGRPFDPLYLSKKFAKLIKKYEFPVIRFHDLRHAHATMLLQQGVNPKIVSERLGHSTISITLDIYSHVLPNMQKEAVQKLEKLFL